MRANIDGRRPSRRLYSQCPSGYRRLSGHRDCCIRSVGSMRYLIIAILLAAPLAAQPVISNVQLTTISHGSVLVRTDITNSPNQSLVQLDYGTTPSFGFSPKNRASSSTDPSRTLVESGLSPSTTYYFRIRATASTGTPPGPAHRGPPVLVGRAMTRAGRGSSRPSPFRQIMGNRSYLCLWTPRCRRSPDKPSTWRPTVRIYKRR